MTSAPYSPVRVLVVGGGIGGLTTALSLAAAGIRAEVVESATELRPLGVGINLQPHAVRELTELGFGAALARMAVPTAEMVHFDRHGNRIWAEPRGLAAGYRWPQYSVHRGELQMLLAEAVRDRLGPQAIRTAATVLGFEQDDESVRIRVRNRHDDTVTTLDGDLLVGADGLHSTIRKQLHPDGPGLQWNGVRMWRGIAEWEPFLTGASLAIAGTNAQAKFVAYPISRTAADRGRVLVNWVAEVKTDDDRLGTPADWNRQGDLADVLPHFADWVLPWLDVPALMTATEAILEYPMVDRDPLPWWTDRRVTLLGDAAHPMYPIGSNGGSQAILDARVLAQELALGSDPVKALAGYEARRREPTSAIVLACREMPADRILLKVADRAPEGFARIEDVLTPAELADLTSAYTRTTSVDATALNTRPSWSVAQPR
jgi:2-polyprenyl-6-methoxyphenol hydroxylase-like FAD-dependent oxidoreductase